MGKILLAVAGMAFNRRLIFDEQMKLSPIAAGMQEVLQKPMVPEVLLKILENHRPQDHPQRQSKVSLTIESRILEKAQQMAREKGCSAESVLLDFLGSKFYLGIGDGKSNEQSLAQCHRGLVGQIERPQQIRFS